MLHFFNDLARILLWGLTTTLCIIIQLHKKKQIEKTKKINEIE